MNITKILGLSLLLAGGGLSGISLQAADPKPPVEAKEGDKAPEGTKAVPYQGKVSAIDPALKTFTLNGKTKDKERVFRVLESTQILLNGQASEFKALAVGQLVRGQAYKRSEGWEAKKVMIGPKEEAAPAK